MKKTIILLLLSFSNLVYSDDAFVQEIVFLNYVNSDVKIKIYPVSMVFNKNNEISSFYEYNLKTGHSQESNPNFYYMNGVFQYDSGPKETYITIPANNATGFGYIHESEFEDGSHGVMGWGKYKIEFWWSRSPEYGYSPDDTCTLEGLDYVMVESIQPLNNGNILFAGRIQYQINSDRDFFVMRTDSMLSSPPAIGIYTISHHIPDEFQLYQNYPNPFNPVTMIKYEIPKDAFITIKVYDILGREVFSYNEFKTAGSYGVRFDGTNYASGMYFYSLESGSFKETKKMVLIK